MKMHQVLSRRLFCRGMVDLGALGQGHLLENLNPEQTAALVAQVWERAARWPLPAAWMLSFPAAGTETKLCQDRLPRSVILLWARAGAGARCAAAGRAGAVCGLGAWAARAVAKGSAACPCPPWRRGSKPPRARCAQHASCASVLTRARACAAQASTRWQGVSRRYRQAKSSRRAVQSISKWRSSARPSSPFAALSWSPAAWASALATRVLCVAVQQDARALPLRF